MLKSKGFTLLELIIVIIIMGLLALIAAPSYNRMIENQKAREAYQLWQSSFYFAQHESMRLKDRVVLCPSNATGDDCATNKKDYEFGWLVFAESTKSILQDVPINIAKDKTVIAVDKSATFKFNANGRLNTTPTSIFICIDKRNGFKLSDGGKSCTKDKSFDRKHLTVSSGGRLTIQKK